MADHVYTLDEVREGIRAIVNEVGPDFVYISPDGMGCVYIAHDEPSCLIGRYLDKIGVSAWVLRECNEKGSFGAIRDTLADLGLRFTDAAASWMNLVQSRQDNRVPWGEAVAWADQQLEPASS